MKKKKEDCLIEFFSEEIPAGMQKSVENQIGNLFKNELSIRKLSYNKVTLYSTPRRFAIKINDLDVNQEDQSLEIKGPNINAPEIAIKGFLKAQNVPKEKVYIKETNKGNFYFIKKFEIGKSIYILLPKIIDDVVKKINWPKSQRWANFELKWGRPLRNILVLVGSKKIKGSISLSKDESLIFNNCTFSHRFFNKKIIVQNTNQYKSILKKYGVFVDRGERKENILKQVKIILNKNKLKLFEDEKLLDEIVGLVELPNVHLGRIDKKFMKLPFEVLSTSMKVHQKYFSLINDEDKMAPFFLVVSNTQKNKNVERNVIKGNERVLKARLSDALFFWDTDITNKFEKWLEKLKDVTYYEGLGNLYDRSVRISEIAFQVSKFFNYEKREKSKQVGIYSKVDLVSNMVGEFPELQGIMGGYYSKKNGFDNEFKAALFEQYKPLGYNDEIPNSTLGCILSLSNNIDALISFFSIGLIPSGSRDPFALRRAMNAVIKVLINKEVGISFPHLLELTQPKNSPKKSETLEGLKSFFVDRLRTSLLDQNYSVDIINSIIMHDVIKNNSLYFLIKRLKTLTIFSSKKIGKDFIKNYKRIFNILKNVPLKSLPREVDRKLLETEGEKKLFNFLEKIKKINTNKMIEDEEILRKFFDSIKVIENFFDTTLVNVDNNKVRLNRLKILHALKCIFEQFCSFEMIDD